MSMLKSIVVVVVTECRRFEECQDKSVPAGHAGDRSSRSCQDHVMLDHMKPVPGQRPVTDNMFGAVVVHS